MIENLDQHVSPARVERLDEILSHGRSYSKEEFSTIIRKISRSGHSKALENYLYANRFIKRDGLAIEIQERNWRAYRSKALATHRPQPTRYRALVNLPQNAGIKHPPVLGDIRGAMDELLRKPTGPVIVLSPFLDANGIKFVRAAASKAQQAGCSCLLLTRLPIYPSEGRNHVRKLIESLEDTNIKIASFHEQDPNQRYVKLSFHAKGLYMPKACVLATMNLISANMDRNVEFGIKIEGAVAEGYFEVLSAMAKRNGPLTINEALEQLGVSGTTSA